MSEEVIELSVEETNALRAKLGLAPLRLSNGTEAEQPEGEDSVRHHQKDEGGEEVLEMSVDETNALRAKLGLAPLRENGGSLNKIVHKPAENQRELQEAQERVERAKLQRDVDRGIATVFGSSTLADDDIDNKDGKVALSWADKMRATKKGDASSKGIDDDKTPQRKKKESSRKRKQEKSSLPSDYYDENDLVGMKVAHSASELQTGSSTILTLADAPLLETTESTSKRTLGLNEGGETLENVNLAEQRIQQEGLQKKRQYELGMGRAGGYAGFDDDEFEELGGTRGPSRLQRGGVAQKRGDLDSEKQTNRGFRIGDSGDGSTQMSDFEAIQQGKAISLVQNTADVAASDFMTIEEEEEERARRKQQKDGKFKKKKKKDKKKERKKNRRQKSVSDDEDDKEPATEKEYAAEQPSTSLLDDLEQTAVASQPTVGHRRKRNRSDSMDEGETEPVKLLKVDGTSASVNPNGKDKRARFDAIMAKGNERTRVAFSAKSPETKKRSDDYLDEEPDDSFLNAALSKARRMNRLKEMNQKNNSGPSSSDRGADAVVKAVQSMKQEGNNPDPALSTGTMTFSIDDTREFTRALRARERHQKKSKLPVLKADADLTTSMPHEGNSDDGVVSSGVKEEDGNQEEEEVDEDVDMEELAKEVKPDVETALDGTTASSVGVGRGLSAFVSMLRHTGEISAKHAGTEELRGRAKDERNYDDYKPLDLKNVVKIGANATDKDKELASRDIKLEYRDKHGRLLTRKEAFRDLCYQFHGYGKGKRKEEKHLEQIARERAEARLASRQVAAARDGTTAGTLGALKATQKATGKAFVLHKI